MLLFFFTLFVLFFDIFDLSFTDILVLETSKGGIAITKQFEVCYISFLFLFRGGVEYVPYIQQSILYSRFTEYERIRDIPRTVGEVAGAYPDNVLLITMPSHITCSRFGVVHDSFDCRNRLAEYCWKVK